MCRRHLILIFAVFLVIPLVGCGIGNILPGKDVPPLDGYTTVVMLPFEFKKPSAEYANMPLLISYTIGTKLKIRREESTWIFDQSEEVSPVSERLKELNISPKDVFEDPLTARKVAEAFQADLVIAGRLDEPKFSREDSGKVEHEMSEASIGMGKLAHAMYYAVYQRATLRADIKIIDPKVEEPIWDGKLFGDKKYKTRYRTGSPKKFQRDETMLADIRKLLSAAFVDKLYPAREVAE